MDHQEDARVGNGIVSPCCDILRTYCLLIRARNGSGVLGRRFQNGRVGLESAGLEVDGVMGLGGLGCWTSFSCGTPSNGTLVSLSLRLLNIMWQSVQRGCSLHIYTLSSLHDTVRVDYPPMPYCTSHCCSYKLSYTVASPSGSCTPHSSTALTSQFLQRLQHHNIGVQKSIHALPHAWLFVLVQLAVLDCACGNAFAETYVCEGVDSCWARVSGCSLRKLEVARRRCGGEFGLVSWTVPGRTSSKDSRKWRVCRLGLRT